MFQATTTSRTSFKSIPIEQIVEDIRTSPYSRQKKVLNKFIEAITSSDEFDTEYAQDLFVYIVVQNMVNKLARLPSCNNSGNSAEQVGPKTEENTRDDVRTVIDTLYLLLLVATIFSWDDVFECILDYVVEKISYTRDILFVDERALTLRGLLFRMIVRYALTKQAHVLVVKYCMPISELCTLLDRKIPRCSALVYDRLLLDHGPHFTQYASLTEFRYKGYTADETGMRAELFIRTILERADLLKHKMRITFHTEAMLGKLEQDTDDEECEGDTIDGDLFDIMRRYYASHLPATRCFTLSDVHPYYFLKFLIHLSEKGEMWDPTRYNHRAPSEIHIFNSEVAWTYLSKFAVRFNFSDMRASYYSYEEDGNGDNDDDNCVTIDKTNYLYLNTWMWYKFYVHWLAVSSTRTNIDNVEPSINDDGKSYNLLEMAVFSRDPILVRCILEGNDWIEGNDNDANPPPILFEIGNPVLDDICNCSRAQGSEPRGFDSLLRFIRHAFFAHCTDDEFINVTNECAASVCNGVNSKLFELVRAIIFHTLSAYAPYILGKPMIRNFKVHIIHKLLNISPETVDIPLAVPRKSIYFSSSRSLDGCRLPSAINHESDWICLPSSAQQLLLRLLH
ncbi:hypothetical protein GE061_016763 [Apolygus lucorum]|uniref:Uncharacterized protein n=1 Tax=Apolygus lucorum TaxID=248454 RepID=A0A8S9XI90_APOLU|nr:hypothetical protein GE061_016763 [Apolygus lucorum]